ncbi:uncharacterized protein EAF01_011337 [Botrytis porri]|uniref:Alcohol dehydrogenase-like C-terminal domain-containing protein n=1 Tax=Botrytis porri TaxID=87229 RepID=A0A4Z1KX89_9HELO|nr:uncharacterized protein EAF01_011337 [Botrytis porri]KAF7885272.1 hypothetical protein EAF01_011337 [Botrytis porri]TGO89205.1 hypothetical protein BPOR_0120g00130 [Botrytis porri]
MAGEKHHEYLVSIGATAASDYRDPEVVRNVIEEVNTLDMGLEIGFHATTENVTSQLSADILSAMGNRQGKLVLTLP